MLKQLLMLTANVSKIKGSVLSNIISYKENCLLGNKKKYYQCRENQIC